MEGGGRRGARPGARGDRGLATPRVRSVIVCLKDSQLVVSCGGTGAAKPALAQIEPVCRRVLESLTISEE